MKFTREELWTQERISRFWDIVVSEPRLQHKYFSYHHAENIVNFAQIYGLDGANVLDYGCGPGFLSEELVKRGFSTTAMDYSQFSIEKINVALKKNPNWHGAFTTNDLPDKQKFDWVFSIETFEHLRDEWIDDYCLKIYNNLNSGGFLFLSTRHKENLDEEFVICPCCEVKFHPWGHLQSVSPKKLSKLMEAHGFDVELCRRIDLNIAGNLHKKTVFKALRILDKLDISLIIKTIKKIRLKIVNRSMNYMTDKNTLILIAKKNG